MTVGGCTGGGVTSGDGGGRCSREVSTTFFLQRFRAGTMTLNGSNVEGTSLKMLRYVIILYITPVRINIISRAKMLTVQPHRDECIMRLL